VRQVLAAAERRMYAREKLAYGTRRMLAVLAARTRQLEVAEKLYRACLEQPGGPRELEPEVYDGLLRVLALRHKHEEVITLAKQALETAHASNRLVFHDALAKAYGALGKNKEALESAGALVRDAGSKSDRLYGCRLRVRILTQAGRHKEAIAEGQALLKEYNQGGDLRDVRYVLSAAYSAAGQHDESEEQLRLILEADPADAGASNDLGYQWADRNKNLAEAEKLIRKALELDRQQRKNSALLSAEADQENAAYIDSLGWVLFRRGRLAEACKELERAATLPEGAEDPVVWDHLGDVYFRLERPAKAAEVWRKALALYDTGARSKSDGRYKDIQDKLKLVKP
jgi:tetratricopeptide (TPR) repeat protein